MKISNYSYKSKKLMRYFSNRTCSKTLNHSLPKSVLLPHTFQKPSFLYNFSFGSPSVCYFESDPLHKKQSLCSFLNAVYGGPSIYSPNPCFFRKNYFLSNSSGGLSSSSNFELHSLHKKQFLCNFAFGRPSEICSLVPPFSESLSSLIIYKHNCSNICFYYVRVHQLRIHYRSHFRRFSVSSSHPTSISGSVEEDIVQSVGAGCTDEVQLEMKIGDGNEMNVPSNFVLQIVDIIKHDGEDWKSRLSKAASKLNVKSISEIFEVLNSQRISGLRFFEWVRRNNPKLHMNADVCSLIIDNCGCLDDYLTMNSLLKEFKSEKICLTNKAFVFLPILASTNDSLVESLGRVVGLLNEVGGSCRNSGIYALIEMFCKSDLFEMAKYVMEITEKKDSYYNILIREYCRRDRVEDARGIISEMRESGCVPNAKTYNYLFGNLCKYERMDDAYKLLEEMNKAGSPPDASTFGVLIHFLCSSGKVDHAYKFLDQMASGGLVPLPKTHTSMVKALFVMEKYEEAHKYVVDSSVKYKTTGNIIYNFLADLHREKGDIISAQNVLVEMMEKGFKPNFISYINIVKRLKISGRANLAVDLKGRFSKLVLESHPIPR